MENFNGCQVEEFIKVVKKYLPSYIKPEVVCQETAGNFIFSLIFPDSSKVSYVYYITPETQFDNELARHCISHVVDISIVNLNSHLKLLKTLKETVDVNSD